MSGEHAEQVVPLFIPKLAELLYWAESEKASPLTEAEVIEIRDRAVVVIVRESAARQMAEKRGPDINPENAWTEWQQIRRGT